MIEKFFRIFSGLGFAAEPNAFGDCSIDQFFFGGRFKNFIERGFGSLLIDLLQPKVSLQTSAADGPLAQAKRRVTLGELRVIEVTVLAEARDDFFDVCLRRAASF